MSQAWISFAKSGDPNHAGLPQWPEYTPDNGASMIFDQECQVKNHHDQKLLQIASEE